MTEQKITSLDIKYALMCYLSFKSNWLCANACMDNAVMEIKNTAVIDIEIKVNKYDLWKGEARKRKHKTYKSDSYSKQFMPNRFYICVPISLEGEAKAWVEQTNNKYGIIRYNPNVHPMGAISIIKTASTLQKEINKNLERKIMMRVCSENIGLIGKVLLKSEINKNE